MNKLRIMKLAGLLTESQMAEAQGNPQVSNLAGAIKYFKSVRTMMDNLCDEVLQGLSQVQSEDDLASVVDTFDSHALELTNLDSSFEDFYDYWLDSQFNLDYSRKIIRELPEYQTYFQDLKQEMKTLCDGVLKILNNIKAKGAAATPNDKGKAKKFFLSRVGPLTDIDNSFETWTEWCTGNLFKRL